MTDINTLTDAYKAQDEKIKQLEEQLVTVKAERSRLAKEVFDLQGDKPFQLDGKEVVVANMKGTYFLRAPFGGGGGKKKVVAAPAV